ncbi:ATP-dependent helicase [Acidithiobacillus ferridurans]|uniref:UvrD-helicase domain-containing protein n=1 Tax=Acidithiobacillus ferridurans TaxID=1232575 RepID=UPI001C07E098|nr:UvrD-helicase domain-containing protein [Acidithiobacillus ferridurans]MBU2805895.1 ATP-dependent helicase [Acidithiobacillus ferridurans]
MSENRAEVASRVALERVYAALTEGRSFRLEAGAGAGKTYSLIKALEFLIDKHQRDMPRRGQQIACITYTNVARDEIVARTDRHPIIRCDTNHAFCWSLISGFQRQLREMVAAMPVWVERIAEAGGLGERSIEYSLGFRAVRETSLSLHHDDVLPLTISLMGNLKFRRLLGDRYPIILIDEYQDTDAAWVEAIKQHFLGVNGPPLFGFFGDHWQKIYGNGCGKLEHPAVEEIGKEANFRSVQTIVTALNAMRPELPQFVEDPQSVGEVRVFLTNDWQGQRQTGGHWGGDLPTEVAHEALVAVRAKLEESGWDITPEHTKILMLTHRRLAAEQGYVSLPDAFRHNESFTRKEHPYISFFVDVLEPASEAYAARHYGRMFEALGSNVPYLRRSADKVAWARAMGALIALRENATVGDVLDHLRATRRPRLPDTIEERERELAAFDRDAAEEMPPALSEIDRLRRVPYAEIQSLRSYLEGSSPFETKHGVKGAEFENVLVIVGCGWNQYNFNEMLERASEEAIPASRLTAYERNRNLFYVACSRPRRRLALLFTQCLSLSAIATLQRWFGADSIEALVL